MFSVSGWSVPSSALKQQTENAKQTQDSAQQSNNSPKPDGSSKKRKRDDNVTKNNVDLMYRRHIEGRKPPTKGQKQAVNSDGTTEKPWKRKQRLNGIVNQVADSNGKPSGETTIEPASPQVIENEGSGKVGNKKGKNKKQQPQEKQAASNHAPTSNSLPVAPPKTATTLTPLQQAMQQKLISSRFRHLNETLYTTPSTKALELFSANPELFDEYHAGFSRQVKESWPSNPVDGYVKAIRARGGIRGGPKKGNKPDRNPQGQSIPLPRRPNGLCTVADLGCGDAQLARALIPSSKKLNLKLLSFDLHAPEGSPITKADISNLPVEEGTVDVAIFCLSLMGTNWVSFVEEAWRVLRGDGKGECWVSEVKSRFGKVNRKKAQIGAKKPPTKPEKKKSKKKQGNDDDDDMEDDEIYAEDARPTNDDETDITAFIEIFKTRGFVLKPESVDKSNKMFIRMEFVKQGGAPTKGKHASMAVVPRPGKKRFIEKPAVSDKGMSEEQEAAVLKPCVYKIR